MGVTVMGLQGVGHDGVTNTSTGVGGWWGTHTSSQGPEHVRTSRKKVTSPRSPQTTVPVLQGRTNVTPYRICFFYFNLYILFLWLQVNH